MDCLYVSGRKAKRFEFLPELELPRSFRFRVARDWASRIGEPRVRAYVLKKLKELSARIRTEERAEYLTRRR